MLNSWEALPQPLKYCHVVMCGLL